MGKWASGPRKFWGFQRKTKKKKTKERKVWENTCSPRIDDWDNRMATVRLMSQNKRWGCLFIVTVDWSAVASRKYDNSSYRLGHWFHHWFHQNNNKTTVYWPIHDIQKKKWKKIWPLSLRIKQKARKEEEKLLVSYLYHKKISGQSALTNK